MRQMPKSRLPQKYREELFCNEVMLLPYYIASMNIEHAYWELTGRYEPFEGISLVDTFELAEGHQMPLFAPENTQRVARQKNTPIFVIIGNPPYNAHQVNQNDNSQNRKYPEMDKHVAETYAKDSRLTNKVALSDVYIKAFRWASDRIGDEGIVAYVTNSGFVDGLAFDGMRKHLSKDFDFVYILDLGGNVRKNPKLSGTTHNVFGIQVGVSISFLVKTKRTRTDTQASIYYARANEFWRKEEKYDFLDQAEHWQKINWQTIKPNIKGDWLTEGLQDDFEGFLPIGTKHAKVAESNAIFNNYGRGVATSRDTWVYNFDRDLVSGNIRRMIEVYNAHVYKWATLVPKPRVDDYIDNDGRKVSWSRDLKLDLQRGNTAEFADNKIRSAAYRPFSRQFMFFDRILNDEVYQFPSFFPTPEAENTVICVTDKGSQKPFMVIMTDQIADLHIVGAGASAQCFPFYTYDEDGRNRRENITDWALAQFRARYVSETSEVSKTSEVLTGDVLTKWDIFYYVYALLHHPEYRTTYAANLRRELPRIPFVRDFWGFVRAGERLAEIHVHYEQQREYPLRHVENPDAPLNYRVEKMRLSKDKRSLVYNAFLTLEGIPAEVYEYKLGNRSALEWVIDQYRVTVDARSGIVNDPNNLEDEGYILRLVKQVVTVSLETVRIVNQLPGLEIMNYE
jgi:predicted helicase